MRYSKISVILLLSLLLAINLIQIPQVVQAPTSTLFMNMFSEWQDYIHCKLNITDFSLHHEYYVDSEKNWATERWNLAYHALFCTFAYEHTNDAKYLFEAVYFVDLLEQYTSDNSLVIYPLVGENHWLYADAALLWAEAKLNEYGWGNYNVTDTVDYIISVADKNTTDYLGWAYYWGQGQQHGMCYNTYILFEGLLAYLTNKEMKDYSYELTKIENYTEETGRFTSGQYIDLYRYLEGDLTPTVYTWHIPYGYLLLDYYKKDIINYTALDDTIAKLVDQTAWAESATTIYLAAPLCELLTINARSVPDEYRSAFKKGIDHLSILKRFNLGNFHASGRGQCFTVAYLMLALALSYRTMPPTYTYGSYTYEDYCYKMDFVFNRDQTMIKTTNGYEMFYEGYGFTTMWSGLLNEGYDTFTWNSSGQYFKGFRAGFGALTGYDVTTYFYPNGWKHENWIAQIRTGYYRTLLYSTGLANTAHIHLLFSNRTWFNVTASSSQWVYPTEYWALLQSGRFCIFKTNATNNAVEIYADGSLRILAADATYYLSVPRGFYPEANAIMTTSDQAKYIEDYLIAYMNGTDLKDQKIDTPEGSIKWQFKHCPEFSIYVNKNMTTISYTTNTLSFKISATTNTTSTSKVYCGTKGSPSTINGATSWTYNATSKILTITRLHNESLIEISVFWYPTEVYAVEVVVGGIVAVSTGSFIFWYWRRQKKARTVSAP